MNHRPVDHVVGFEDDLGSFIGRLRDRAKVKLEKGEPSPLDDEEARETAKEMSTDEVQYEPAGVGPGGLDPNEVFPTLPEDLQECFISQDVNKIKEVIAKMDPAEAEYHMKRCVDSGLWVQ